MYFPERSANLPSAILARKHPFSARTSHLAVRPLHMQTLAIASLHATTVAVRVGNTLLVTLGAVNINLLALCLHFQISFFLVFEI